MRGDCLAGTGSRCRADSAACGGSAARDRGAISRTGEKVVKENPEYKTEVEKMNFQAPWVLGVDETKAELQKQLDHFMAFEQYLK